MALTRSVTINVTRGVVICCEWNSMKHLAVFACLVLWPPITVAAVAGLPDLWESALSTVYSFDPSELDGLKENSEQRVHVSCNRTLSVLDSVTLKVASVDPEIADVSSDSVITFQCEPLSALNMSQFSIRGRFLGRTVISVKTLNATRPAPGVRRPAPATTNDSLPTVDYRVSVVRRVRFIDHLFLGLVAFMVICANVGMGCKIDLAVVKEVLTKPIAPAIGFACQYVIMPLVRLLWFLHFQHSI